MRVSVITESDRASRGEYEALSGPEIERVLREALPGIDVVRRVVPDDVERILEAFRASEDADWILTTGGTGPAPRDLTPEATREWIDREVPGIAEALRAESWKETRNSVFSRALAGMRGKQFVANLPGSVKAVRLCSSILAPLLEHGTRMAEGGGHG